MKYWHQQVGWAFVSIPTKTVAVKMYGSARNCGHSDSNRLVLLEGECVLWSPAEEVVATINTQAASWGGSIIRAKLLYQFLASLQKAKRT